MSILTKSSAHYYFNITDGWGGNLDSGGVISDSFKPSAEHKYTEDGSTSALPPGAVVMLNHDGSVPIVECPLLDANVNLTADKAAPKRFYMVATGNTVSELSGRYVNKVTCIRGQFTVETAHVKGTPSIGAALTVEHGAGGTVEATLPHNDVAGVPGINLGRLTAAASGDPVLGYVRETRVENGFTIYTVEMSF
jgi:hypothetical protein